MKRVISYILLVVGVVLTVVGVEGSHTFASRPSHLIFGLSPNNVLWLALAALGGFSTLAGLVVMLCRIYAVAAAERDLPQQLERAEIFYLQRELPQAIAAYRQALRVQPDCVEALNNLAFLLATAADESLRDGAEAVQLAERAAHLPQVPGMCVAGTLAAAYAEAGRFPEAVATAEKAYQDEAAAGKGRFAALNWQFLTLYRARQAWHGTTTDRFSTHPSVNRGQSHDFFPYLPRSG